LTLDTLKDEGDEVEEGLLTCPDSHVYPIAGFIPRMLPGALSRFPCMAQNGGFSVADSSQGRLSKRFSFLSKRLRSQESFGRQWLAYHIENPEEDQAYFSAFTGFTAEEIRNHYVLDAGCGSGKYSYVAAMAGAKVVAVDISQAVEKAHILTRALPHVEVVQADLTRLPFMVDFFPYMFSIGVLHHTPNPRASFRHLVPFLKPGGKIAVWVYPLWSRPREIVNWLLRSVTTRLPYSFLHGLAHVSVPLGYLYLRWRDAPNSPLGWSMKALAASFPSSTHPDWRRRVCDTFDWYSPPYQWHHSKDGLSSGLEKMNWSK
jgi:SAM-dependent methyltransferase